MCMSWHICAHSPIHLYPPTHSLTQSLYLTHSRAHTLSAPAHPKQLFALKVNTCAWNFCQWANTVWLWFYSYLFIYFDFFPSGFLFIWKLKSIKKTLRNRLKQVSSRLGFQVKVFFLSLWAKLETQVMTFLERKHPKLSLNWKQKQSFRQKLLSLFRRNRFNFGSKWAGKK